MNVSKYVVLFLLSLPVVTVGTLSADEGQKSTPIAQIDGVDVVLGADSVIAKDPCADFRCSLWETDVDFLVSTPIVNGTQVVLFSDDDRGVVCSIASDYDLLLSTTVHGVTKPCR